MRDWVLQVQRQAERDLMAIGEHLQATAGPHVAHAWMVKFESAILRLGETPYVGVESDLLGEGRRRIVLRPYIIVYRVVEPDLVRVLRVVDGRRDLPALFSKSG